MHEDVAEILVTREEIDERCRVLGKEISDYYKEKNSKPLLIGLLKGSVPFMVDLMKNMDVDLTIDFMYVTSYIGTASSEIKILKDVDESVTGKDVLIVEDIIDTGKTLDKVVELLKAKGANDIKIVTLLNKKGVERVSTIEADYVGFIVPNKFVIGFGLDYNQKYRNLPYIGVIKPEAI